MAPTTWWSATVWVTVRWATVFTSRMAARPATFWTETSPSRRSRASRLPGQFLPFDHNDGAGFWWANSLNSFTRNVAVECDRYGYRYEATPDSTDRLVRPVQRPAGTVEEVDIRTLPFVRFDGNEAHTQLYGMNMGEGAGGVGPDESHPFVIKDMKVWDCLWSFRPGAHVDCHRRDRHFALGVRDLRSSVRCADSTLRPMTARGVNLPGVLPASPTAVPGEQAPLPVGTDDRPPFSIITSGDPNRRWPREGARDHGR